MQEVIRGRVLHIRINEAKGMQKPVAETGDHPADIDMPMVEDEACFPLYVDGRLLQGEFTSQIVVEETRFTY